MTDERPENNYNLKTLPAVSQILSSMKRVKAVMRYVEVVLC